MLRDKIHSMSKTYNKFKFKIIQIRIMSFMTNYMEQRNVLFVIVACVCTSRMCWGGAHSAARLWRSEDNFLKAGSFTC